MSGPDDMMDGVSPDELLAMDVALGALGRDERRAAELRQRSDPAFRALVEDWSARLSPLNEATPQLLPPGSVWQGITDEIAPAPARTVTAAPARAGFWNSLAVWRSAALAGAAAAAIALTQVGPAPPPPGAPPQILVAALAAADGTPLLSAAYDPLRGAVVLTPATQRNDGDKSAELWVIEGETPPRSLGVIDIKGPNAHVIPVQRLQGLQSGATLAISIEPFGGSPTGLPTGPVVATGKLSAV
ncbi:MAG: anti-sigma factor [Polymorphobacter sp.]